MSGEIDGSDLFGALPPEVRAAVEAAMVPVRIEGGTVLIREGTAADGVYVVTSGRLQARRDTAPGTVVLGEVGRGEVVGEAALLTSQPRGASVVALRDTELLHLSVESFDRLIAEHPAFLRAIASQVVGRLERSGRGPQSARTAATLALVAVHPTPRAETAAEQLAAALVAQGGRVVVVHEAPSTVAGGEAMWAHDLEADHDLVVFQAGSADLAWAKRGLRQADAVIVVADASSRPTLTAVEELVAEHRSHLEVPVELVLCHPPNRDVPTGTSEWLRGRSIRRHHHVRVGLASDMARVARLVTNRGIGLVLSGGGARCMAEIGVVQALRDLDIPIDAVGGTSGGSLVGGAVARGWPVDQIRSTLRRGMVERSNPMDLTIPFIALASGQRITDRLRESAGEAEIEDLWLDYFCVSTNLSSNEAKVHRRGLGWRAIRASMSIPGVFPPVADEGDVLVDGGLVDNLPVGEMRRGHEGITVVAVDVGVRRGLTAGDLPDSTVVRGWRIALDRIDPRRRSPNIAGLLTILARLTELGGGANDEADRGDVLIRPEVAQFPMLDFSKFDELVRVGRRDGLAVLDGWWSARR